MPAVASGVLPPGKRAEGVRFRNYQTGQVCGRFPRRAGSPDSTAAKDACRYISQRSSKKK